MCCDMFYFIIVGKSTSTNLRERKEIFSRMSEGALKWVWITSKNDVHVDFCKLIKKVNWGVLNE
jgi:hypothetical protein